MRRRQSVIRLSGGLPQVVCGWREAGIDSGDPIPLREIADSVRTGRFGCLASALEKAPAAERELLLAVALLEHPLTASDLTDLLQRPPGIESVRDCYDPLRVWSERHLLRQQVPESLPASDRAPVFGFEHERKRQVALATLSGTLGDRGKSIHERAYHFLLSRIDLLSLPAEQFFTDALELLGRSRYLAHRGATDTARLRLLAELAGTGQKPVEADSAAWDLPQDWPRNLQAQFFHLSLRTGYGDREKIRGTLKEWLSGRQKPPAHLGRARALAAPLRSLAFQAFSLHSSRMLGRILWELHDLHAAFGSSAEIAETFAGTASLAAVAAAGRQELGNLDVMLGFLRNLYRTFPERYSMAELLAKGLVMAAALNGKLGLAAQTEQLLPEIRDLAARFPERPWTEQTPRSAQAHFARRTERSVTEDLANALARAAPAFCERLEMGRFEDVAGQLRVLQRAFPKDVGVALNYAESINCGLAAYAKLQQPGPVERLLDEARDLAKSFAWDPRFRWGGLQFREHGLPSEAGKPAVEAPLAPGLPRHIEELITAARRASLHRLEQERHLFKLLISAIASAAASYSDMREADQFAARLGDIRALHNMFPQQTNIAIALSLALGKGVQLYAGRHEEEPAEKLVEELESLENEFDGQPLIAEQMARAAALVIAAFGGPRNTGRVDEWVRAVRRAERKYSGEAPIARWAARAMANASIIHARISRIADIEAILQQLRKLHEQAPGDSARAEAFALVLTNAMLCHFELQHDSTIEALLRELRGLAAQFAGQSSFAAHAAAGIRVSVWALCQSGEIEKAEERLVELHQLRGAYPNELPIAAAWQQALMFYKRRRAGAVPRAAVIAEELALAIAGSFQQARAFRAQSGRVEADLAAMRDLWRAHSTSPVIGGCLATMLSRAAKLYAHSGEMAQADALSDEWRRVHALLPGMPDPCAAQPAHPSMAQLGKQRALTKS
jgi:hypothetical protein